MSACTENRNNIPFEMYLRLLTKILDNNHSNHILLVQLASITKKRLQN